MDADATFDGYNAYYTSLPPACPYPPGSREAADWWAGWTVALSEDVGDAEEETDTDD
jgi:hypothetical protein